MAMVPVPKLLIPGIGGIFGIFPRLFLEPIKNVFGIQFFSTMTLVPNVKWAQRKENIYITVDVPNASNVTVDLEESGSLKFACDQVKDKSTDKYAFSFTLLKEINKEESKWHNGGRNIQFSIVKKNKDEEFWSNLTKEKKLRYVQCDWDKWVDEDDDKGGDEDVMDMQGGGMNFGGGGGMGGMGGMDMEAMMKQMQGMKGGMGGMGGMGGGDEEEEGQHGEDDKNEMPSLENID
jgi:hypothetical protein